MNVCLRIMMTDKTKTIMNSCTRSDIIVDMQL